MKPKPHLEQSMEEKQMRKELNRHWHASAAGDANAEHEIYDDDAVCDYPQSGERIFGRINLQALRSHHPGKPSGLNVRRILGRDGLRNGSGVCDALMAKVKAAGIYASVVGPPPNAKLHPTVKVEAFSSHPDAASMLALAVDIVNGKFKIRVDHMIPLADAAKAHAEAKKCGIGKVLLLA